MATRDMTILSTELKPAFHGELGKTSLTSANLAKKGALSPSESRGTLKEELEEK